MNTFASTAAVNSSIICRLLISFVFSDKLGSPEFNRLLLTKSDNNKLNDN